MLCGIVSDTMNLRSPTTTQFDRNAVKALSHIVGMDTEGAIGAFAKEMFAAKSDVSHLTTEGKVTLDFKTFQLSGKKVGWGSGQTVDPAPYIANAGEYIEAAKSVKAKNSLDLMFFAITNIDPTVAQPTSLVFIVGPEELAVAKAAFPLWKPYTPPGASQPDPRLLDVGTLASRKTQFIPGIGEALSKGQGKGEGKGEGKGAGRRLR